MGTLSMPAPTPRSLRGAACAFLLFAACKEEEEITWSAFNAEGESVQVQISEEAPEGAEPVETLLRSTAGAVDVGSASVTPGIVAPGELVRVDVRVGQEWAAGVGRVSVEVESGDRGADSYELAKDSAGVGAWIVELQAVGDAGESRTDTFTFRLWQAVEE